MDQYYLTVFSVFIQAPDEVIRDTELEVPVSNEGILPRWLAWVEPILRTRRTSSAIF